MNEWIKENHIFYNNFNILLTYAFMHLSLTLYLFISQLTLYIFTFDSLMAFGGIVSFYFLSQ